MSMYVIIEKNDDGSSREFTFSDPAAMTEALRPLLNLKTQEQTDHDAINENIRGQWRNRSITIE